MKIKRYKKYAIGICIIFFFVIFIMFFLQKNNKKINMGNNISNKTLDECKEYIYNISSYEAIAEITINSNKNTNKYKIKQKWVNNNETIQEIMEPENVKGVVITYKDNNLKIENTTLNLKKIYQDYPYVAENSLFLSDFIMKYKALKDEDYNCKVERDAESVVYTINWNGKYKKEQKLYIDENTGTPTKMIVEDNNQNVLVYILYNEIKLNDF